MSSPSSSEISADGSRASNAAAIVVRKPGVQKPHCSAWHSRNASCTGCSTCPPRPSSRASPSTVVTPWPSPWTASIRQERTGSPTTSTVHAPQTPCSQPTCVPVSPRSCRSASDSSRRTGTEASRGTPFTVTVIVRSVSTLIRFPLCTWLGSFLGRCPPRAGGAPGLRRCSLAGHPRGGLGGSLGQRAFGEDADQQAPVVGARVDVGVRVDQGARERACGRPVGAVDGLAGDGIGQVVPLGGQAHRDVGGADAGDATVLVQRDDDAGATDRVVALAAGDLGEGGPRTV